MSSALADKFRSEQTPKQPATAPSEVMDEIANGALSLDALGKKMDEAVEKYNAADELWLSLYDAVSETMREEYREAGRKTDPAEHVITSATRKAHRAEYSAWKRAKREVESVRDQIRARSAAMNGRQSQLGALRDEMRADSYGGNR